MEYWNLHITVILALLHTASSVPNGCDGYIDLVLTVDSSNSILESNQHVDPLHEWTVRKDFLKSVVQNLPVGTSTQVSAVRYSTEANVFFHFNQFENSINIQDAIWSMSYLGGNTNTAEAFRTIGVDVMTHSHGERPGARDVLVILTDGLSNLNENLTAQHAINLKSSGFEIFAIATSKEVDVVELRSIASEPSDKYLFQVLSSSELESIVQLLVHRICGLPDPTEGPPPDNDCMVDGCLECQDIYVCSQCEVGKYFDGAWCRECMEHCDECSSSDVCDLCIPGRYWDESTNECEVCGVRADLVFLLDTSGSIRDKNPEDESYDNFQLLKDFVKNLLDRIDTGPDSTRIAVIQFSNHAILEFTLDMFQSKEEMKNAVQGMMYQGGNTNTAGALRMMRQQVLLQARGDRPDFPNIALMITDGESTVDAEYTLDEARRAHSENVTIFVVGVTGEINEEELEEIASDPDEDFFFNSTDIKYLDQILANLVKHVCTPENPNVRRKRETHEQRITLEDSSRIDGINNKESTKDQNSINQEPNVLQHANTFENPYGSSMGNT